MLRWSAVVGATTMLLGWTLGAGTAAAADSSCARAASLSGTAPVREAVDAVVCLVNRERAKRRKAPVRVSRLLARAAKGHSSDMVRRRYFSHVSANGRTMRQRIARTGYMRKRRSCRTGETIAWGTSDLGSPASLVESFMNSPQHKRILLDRRFRDIGVGLVRGVPVDGWGTDGMTLTLNFGRR